MKALFVLWGAFVLSAIAAVVCSSLFAVFDIKLINIGGLVLTLFGPPHLVQLQKDFNWLCITAVMLHSHPWWKFAIGDPAFLCFVWLKSCWRFVCSYPIELLWSWQLDTDSTTLFFFLPGHKQPDFCSEVGNFNKSVKSGSWLIFGAGFKCLFFIFGTSTSASFFLATDSITI